VNQLRFWSTRPVYPGWRLANGKGLAYAENGLIGVSVPTGRQTIELVFTSHHVAEAFVSAASALVSWCWSGCSRSVDETMHPDSVTA